MKEMCYAVVAVPATLGYEAVVTEWSHCRKTEQGETRVVSYQSGREGHFRMGLSIYEKGLGIAGNG